MGISIKKVEKSTFLEKLVLLVVFCLILLGLFIGLTYCGVIDVGSMETLYNNQGTYEDYQYWKSLNDELYMFCEKNLKKEDFDELRKEHMKMLQERVNAVNKAVASESNEKLKSRVRWSVNVEHLQISYDYMRMFLGNCELSEDSAVRKAKEAAELAELEASKPTTRQGRGNEIMSNGLLDYIDIVKGILNDAGLPIE